MKETSTGKAQTTASSEILNTDVQSSQSSGIGVQSFRSFPVSRFLNVAFGLHIGNEPGKVKTGAGRSSESGVRSFPVSEFLNMVVIKKRAQGQLGHMIRSSDILIFHLGVTRDGVQVSGVLSFPSRSLATWDMKEASQGEPRNRGPEFRSPAFGVFLPQISQHDT